MTRALLTLLLLCLVPLGCEREPAPPAQAPSSADDTAEASSPDMPRVVFITGGAGPQWSLAAQGATNAGHDFLIRVDVVEPTGPAEQSRQIESAAAAAVDGIAVAPMDPGTQRGVIDAAAGQTALITHHLDAPGSERACFIGLDEYEAGRLMGELVEQALPEGGAVVLLSGALDSEGARRRRQGCIDELLGRVPDPDRYDAPEAEPLAGASFTVVETRTDAAEPGRAGASVRAALRGHPEARCVVGLVPAIAAECVTAIAEVGGPVRVRVVGFGDDTATLDAVHTGAVVGTVAEHHYMYGYQAVKLLRDLARGDRSGIPDDRMIFIAPVVIRRADVEGYREQLSGAGGR